jgi:cytochrome oxidase Cu insertion factor (SCO1/SenC/PrrC family)
MRIVHAVLVSALISTLASAQSRLGEQAADFTLQSLAGTEVSLSDFRGQVVLINFFGFN